MTTHRVVGSDQNEPKVKANKKKRDDEVSEENY